MLRALSSDICQRQVLSLVPGSLRTRALNWQEHRTQPVNGYERVMNAHWSFWNDHRGHCCDVSTNRGPCEPWLVGCCIACSYMKCRPLTSSLWTWYMNPFDREDLLDIGRLCVMNSTTQILSKWRSSFLFFGYSNIRNSYTNSKSISRTDTNFFKLHCMPPLF